MIDHYSCYWPFSTHYSVDHSWSSIMAPGRMFASKCFCWQKGPECRGLLVGLAKQPVNGCMKLCVYRSIDRCVYIYIYIFVIYRYIMNNDIIYIYIHITYAVTQRIYAHSIPQLHAKMLVIKILAEFQQNATMDQQEMKEDLTGMAREKVLVGCGWEWSMANPWSPQMASRWHRLLASRWHRLDGHPAGYGSSMTTGWRVQSFFFKCQTYQFNIV